MQPSGNIRVDSKSVAHIYKAVKNVGYECIYSVISQNLSPSTQFHSGLIMTLTPLLGLLMFVSDYFKK
jgi:hypothetical protein